LFGVPRPGSWPDETSREKVSVKVVITLGSDAPKPSLVVPMLKLGLLGLGAFLLLSRGDLRRYMRMRKM
jgi:hypothetical protein